MTTTHALVALLKSELKTQGLSYAGLAQALGLSESSVKRMFAAGGEMPLSRVDEICRVLHCDFADLATRLTTEPLAQHELTLAQERAVVADTRLLLVAICCLSQWTVEQMLAAYRLGEADIVKHLAQLDRLGIIELRPLNRYKLRVAKTFRWRPRGPVMQFFRERVVQDFYDAGFDGEGELLTLVHGQLSPAAARDLNERLRRVAEDFARQHLLDQRLPMHEKRSYSLVMGMRSWLFEAFRDLQRPTKTPSARSE